MLLLILQVGFSQDPNMLSDLEKQDQKYKFVINTYKRVVPLKQPFGIIMGNVGDADRWIPGFCQCTDFPSLFHKKYLKEQAFQGFIEG